MAAFEVFKPLRNLALFTIIGLSLLIVGELFSAMIGVGQVVSPDSSVDLEGPMSVWLLLQGVVFLLRLPLLIFTIVMFLIWIYRAYSNLEPLAGRNLQFSPGWAVGWWFIPFANLVKPYQVVREIWEESDPDVPDNEPTFLTASSRTAPTYIGVWWGAWITSNILNNVTERTYDPDSMANIEISGIFFIVTGLLTAAAAVLAIMVVRDITERQASRHLSLSRRGVSRDNPPAPPTFG